MGYVISLPVIIAVAIYYIDKELGIREADNALLREEISFLNKKIQLTSYPNAWSEIESQKKYTRINLIKLIEKLKE
jgi:hypothetical protein